MKIVRAERIPLNLPFYHHRVARAMHRASTHGERVWVVRLESDNGLVGWGDDLGWDQYWDFGGPPPPRPEVEEVQLRIVQQVRQLEEQGQVTIARGDSDDQFV